MLGGSIENSEKIRVYNKGIDLPPTTMCTRCSSITVRTTCAPHLEVTEALRIEAVEFVGYIEAGSRPLIDGEAGLRIVQFLEAATASMRMQGRLSEIVQKGAVVAA
jgi:hypothetical protein